MNLLKSKIPRIAGLAKLILALVCLPAATNLCAQDSSDPSRPGPKLLEAIRALEFGGKTGSSGQEKRATVPDKLSLSLVGLVVKNTGRADGGVAIISNGNEFMLITEGQSIRRGDVNVTATIVDSNNVSLLDNVNNQMITLRSVEVASPSTDDHDLALIELSEVPITLAVQALGYESGLQIALSSETKNALVTLYLQSVSEASALESLVLTNQLYSSQVGESGIIRIQTIEEYANGSAAFNDEKTEIFTLLYPNTRDIIVAIRDLYGDRVRLPTRIDEDTESSELFTQDLQSRLERFDIIDGRGQGLGSSSGGGGSSSSSSSLSSSNQLANSNNRNNRDSNNNRSENTNADQSVTEAELAILEGGDAATFEAVRRARADIFISVIDRLNKIVVRTRDDRTMTEIAEIIKQLDQPTKLVLVEVQLLKVELEDGLDTAFNWAGSTGNFTGGFNPGSPNVVGDLLFGFDDGSFSATFDFLESENRLTVLGKPSLLISNNEVSRIFIGEEIPIVTGFGNSQTIVTDSGNTVNFSDVETENRAVGSTLLITPNINDDSTVTLRLLQEESQVVKDGADILVSDGNGGFENRSVDIIASQNITGTFVVSDSKTLVIGGLIRETLRDRVSKIPVVGDLPLLGRLFSNQSNAVIRNELILLVTPKIIHRSLTSTVTEEYLKRRSYHPTSMDRDASLNTFPKQEVLMNPLPQLELSAQPAAVEDGEPPLKTIPDLTLTPAE